MIVEGADFVNVKPDGTKLISASVITYCLSAEINCPETYILAAGFPFGFCSVVSNVEESGSSSSKVVTLVFENGVLVVLSDPFSIASTTQIGPFVMPKYLSVNSTLMQSVYGPLLKTSSPSG